MYQLRWQKWPAHRVDAVLMSLFSTAMMFQIVIPNRDRETNSDREKNGGRQGQSASLGQNCYIRMTGLLKVDLNRQVSIKVAQLLKVFRILLHHASKNIFYALLQSRPHTALFNG